MPTPNIYVYIYVIGYCSAYAVLKDESTVRETWFGTVSFYQHNIWIF